MTGEVKRYYATSPYSGNEPELVVTWADHLAVVEGLRATLAERDEECLLLSAQNRELDEALAVVEDNARRYEWLRNGEGHPSSPFVCGVHGAPMGDAGWLTGDDLDAAIDEAMRGGDGRG